MTSRIVVNNIQSDSGINTVTFNSEVSSTKFVAGQITVGDTVINSNSIGIGSTSTTTNAGINTALGTIIYNGTTNRIESYGPEGWVTVKSLTQQGHTATGGIINDYPKIRNYLQNSYFTSSGTFSVTTLGSYTETVKVLVVGGGGGGGGTTTGPLVAAAVAAVPSEVKTVPFVAASLPLPLVLVVVVEQVSYKFRSWQKRNKWW